MAYFRCGGGGMPAGLQSGMDAVLNKKFGTSTTYPASDWPDNVNLLGPLPIRTASGAIASFADGADDVPVESGTFYVVPSQAGTGTPSPSNPRAISGYTGMTITKTGANLFYVENSSLFPRDNNTIVDNVGTYTAWAKVKKNTDYYIKKSANTNRQNVFGCTSVPAVGVTTYMLARTEYATNEYRFNSGEYEYIGFYYSNEASENMMLSTSQDALTPYEAYNADTLAVSWQDEAGTVYGGELNVTTGVLTKTWACHKITSIDDINLYSSANGFRLPTASWTEGAMVEQTNSGGICNVEPTQTDSSIEGVRFGLANNNQIYFVQAYNTFGNTVEAFKEYATNNDVYVAYKLATPTTYQLTPHELRTFYGANNFYCDTGDSQLNYRADISLYINNH